MLIKGAGIAGLLTAYILCEKGYHFHILAPEQAPAGSASWFAGGMIAPYCERESAEQKVEDLGIFALNWWQKHFPSFLTLAGTLVVARARDEPDLQHFAQKTHENSFICGEMLHHLEPDLFPRFSKGLFFAKEAHLDPRAVLCAIKERLKEKNIMFLKLEDHIHNLESLEKNYQLIIDTTGANRLALDKNLRGVRGEMLLLRCEDVHLSRPVRLLHPRIPLYIVPRADNVFMVGATMIETEHQGGGSVRSIMELLNAAYTLHPAFAEAEILEIGTGIRPAYSDNLPNISRTGNHIYLNGFYRHGYLLAPYMAMQLVKQVK